MRKYVAAWALALVACATSYEQAVSTTPAGRGRYLVTARGNGYTSLAALYEYVYRRADELCRGEYDVEISDRHSQPGEYYDPYNGLTYRYTRHSVVAQVVCEIVAPKKRTTWDASPGPKRAPPVSDSPYE